MKLAVNFQGTIKLNDCERSFDFKDDRLFIHPDKGEEDYLDNLFKLNKEQNKHEYLIGKTYDNKLVYFIDVIVVKKINRYYAYPKAYTTVSLQTANWNYNDFCFINIKLKSNAIDSFQNVEYQRKFLQHFLQQESKLSEEKISKKFDITEGKCELDTSYIIRLKDKPISIYTHLKISLEERKSIYDVYLLVNKINEVFKFIFNRSNIGFSSIQLETEQQQIQTIGKDNNSIEYKSLPAAMFLINQSNDFEARDINQVIEPILQNFNSLINVVNKDIISYYPKNDEDFYYVDVEKFIKVCGTFEREFDYCFPDWIEINEPEYTHVQKKLLNYLGELDSQFKGINSKVRDKIKSFEYTITHMNEKLEKRLNFAFKEFEYCLNPRFEKYCNRANLHDINPADIFTCFANKRNKYVHTFNDMEFTKEEIAGYVFVRELIYCMILKQAKFKKEEIEQMMNIYQ